MYIIYYSSTHIIYKLINIHILGAHVRAFSDIGVQSEVWRPLASRMLYDTTAACTITYPVAEFIF